MFGVDRKSLQLCFLFIDTHFILSSAQKANETFLPLVYRENPTNKERKAAAAYTTQK